MTADVRFGTNSNLFTTFSVDELALGLKANFKVSELLKYLEMLELQYLHDYMGINCSVGLTTNPVVNFSGVLGNDSLAMGTDVSFDTEEENLTSCNFGASFTNGYLIASLTLNAIDTTLSAAYYHTVKPKTNTVGGAEVTHSFLTNKNAITFGTRHSLDHLTTVMVRLDGFGKASVLLQHEWLPKRCIAVLCEVDLKAIDRRAKIGLGLIIKP